MIKKPGPDNIRLIIYITAVIVYWPVLVFTRDLQQNGDICFTRPLSLEGVKETQSGISTEIDNIINGRKESTGKAENIFLKNERHKFFLITKEKNAGWGVFFDKGGFNGHGTYNYGEIDYTQKNENVRLIYYRETAYPLKIGLGMGMSDVHPWDYSAGIEYDFKSLGLPVSLVLNSSKEVYPAALDLSYKNEFRRFLIGEANFVREWELRSKIGSRSSLFIKQNFFHLNPFERDGEINTGKPCMLALSDKGDIKTAGVNYSPGDNIDLMLSYSIREDDIVIKLKENKQSFGYLQGLGKESGYKGNISFFNKRRYFSILYNFSKWTNYGNARLESWPFANSTDLSGILTEDRVYDYNSEIKSRSLGLETKNTRGRFPLTAKIEYIRINVSEGYVREWKSVFFGMIQDLLDEHVSQVKKLEMFVPSVRVGYRAKKWELSYCVKQYIPWKIEKIEKDAKDAGGTGVKTEEARGKYKGGDFHLVSLIFYF